MFLIVRLLPENAIGLYAAALAIASGQIGAVNPFVQVGFSAVAGHADQEQALKTLARHFRFAALAVTVVGSVAAAATPWGIRLFFGAKFIGANAATLLLIGATAFWGMAQVLQACGPLVILARESSRTCWAPHSCSPWGIPACSRFGISGMAGAMLGAQAIPSWLLPGSLGFASEPNLAVRSENDL